MTQQSRTGRISGVQRERAHRHALFASLATLGVLAIAPVVTHHFALGDLVLLDAVGRMGDVCRLALYRVLAPVHVLAHLLLYSGVVYAAWDRARAWARLRRALGGMTGAAPSPGDTVWAAAVAAHVDPLSITVVPSLAIPAFTTGWLRPRIVIARELVRHLSADELTAVIAHEGAHARRRDPLRLSLLRFLACSFFWLPALRRLADDIADETEIVADDAAIAVAQEPLTLAAAIVALAGWRTPLFHARDGAAQFAGPAHDVMERRVLRLTGVPVQSRSRVTWRPVAAACLALALSWSAGAAVAQPVSARGVEDAAQCMAHHAPRHWLHAFCPPSHHVARRMQRGHAAAAVPCPCD